MALTLQGLPTEILLSIIDSITTPATSDASLMEFEKGETKRKLFQALRATCTELNGKLLHYFGSKYFTYFWIQLTEENLLFLREISRRPIGDYVQDITINVDTLFEQNMTLFEERKSDSSESDESESDDSEDWWASESAAEDKHVGECVLNESVIKVLEDGSCARLSREALPALRNLRPLECAPPSYMGQLKEVNLFNIQGAWWMACEQLLSVTVTSTLNLESLSMWSPDMHPLGLPLSLFGKPVVYPDWMSSVKDLSLYMVDDTFDDETFPSIVHNLSTLFKKLTSMTCLELYLARAPASFFSQLARSLPPMSLTHLHLHYIKMSIKDIDIFLSSTASTLRQFSLSRADFAGLQDFKDLLSSLMSLQLTSIRSESLNIGIPQTWTTSGRYIWQRGLSFWSINKMRPAVWTCDFVTCPHVDCDACEWVFVRHNTGVREVFVNKEEDVDVAYWLQIISDQVQLVETYDHEDELVDEEIYSSQWW